MSQVARLYDGTPTPSTETLTPDIGGVVAPTLNNINLLTGDGLTSTGNPATSTITFTIDGFSLATATTVGAVNADIITLDLGATPTCYIFTCNIVGYESTTPAGCGYVVTGSVKTNGVAATVIPDPDYKVSEDIILIPADINVVAVGNTVVFRLLGTAGLTINWKANIIVMAV